MIVLFKTFEASPLPSECRKYFHRAKLDGLTEQGRLEKSWTKRTHSQSYRRRCSSIQLFVFK